jgi:magnesium chelatase subunit D
VTATDTPSQGAAAWAEACLAARLLALDPAFSGGIWLRARAGPVRDAWLAVLKATLPATTSMVRLPLHATDERLLGGLDLTATLRAGRPVAERGLLAAAHGGILVVTSAERCRAGTAGRIGAALDAGEVSAERDGLALRHPARFAILALDEGIEADERPPVALADRLAIHLDLTAVGSRDTAVHPESVDLEDARGRLAATQVPDDVLEALCAAAAALGVLSLRAPLLALRIARASAALSGRDEVNGEDAAVAARLVLAPRATRLPTQSAEPESAEADTPPEEASPGLDDRHEEQDQDRADPADERTGLDDLVLAAAAAAIPAGLLATLRPGAAGRGRSAAAGSGAVRP